MRRQIDNSILEMALLGYQARRAEVMEKMAEIERQLGAYGKGAKADGATAATKPKREMSAAGRARIAEAQRKRWAVSKQQPVAAKATGKPKRRLSAAGRAAIIAATKKRWALKRAEAAKKS